MNGRLARRGLLQTLVGAGIILFGLFLLWRFLAGVATILLMLLAGVLFAVVLSAPVGALHRRKVPRPVAVGAIIFAILLAGAVPAYLFLPEFQKQSFQLSSLLPVAINDFVRQIREFAAMFGINLGNEGGSPASMLTDLLRQLAGGILDG